MYYLFLFDAEVPHVGNDLLSHETLLVEQVLFLNHAGHIYIAPFLVSAEEVCVGIEERNINKIHVLKGFPVPQQEREQIW